eukprot:scaffold76427_cov57-Phaeocystis_antarctica.AAC.5
MSIWHAASPATNRLAWRICSGSIRGAAAAAAGTGVGVGMVVGVGVAAAAAAGGGGGGVVVGVAAAAAAAAAGGGGGGVVVGVGVGVVVAASLSRSSSAADVRVVGVVVAASVSRSMVGALSRSSAAPRVSPDASRSSSAALCASRRLELHATPGNRPHPFAAATPAPTRSARRRVKSALSSSTSLAT